jgi:hypothetical protein
MGEMRHTWFCRKRLAVPGEAAAAKRGRAVARLAEAVGWERTMSKAKAPAPAEAFLREVDREFHSALSVKEEEGRGRHDG